MRRGLALLVSLIAISSAACDPASPPRHAGAGAATADQRVLRIADAIVDAEFEEDPSDVAFLRPPGARYDTLPDDSLAGLKARDVREDGWRKELREIDPTSLHDPAATLAWQIGTEALETRRAQRVCKVDLWRVDQFMSGWQLRFANLAEAQPVGTPDLRAQTLKRFGGMARYVDDHIANLREGQRLKYLMAAGNVRLVVEQLDKLAAIPPRESPYFSPAQRDPDPAFAAALERILVDGLLPAMRRYRDYLEREYLPTARAAVGVRANPDGLTCYRALVRRHTSLDVSPDEVHARGWKQLAAIEEEMKAISARSFGGAAVPELLAKLRNDPSYRFKDRNEIVQQAEGALGRARAAVPRAFGLQPRNTVRVEPIPSFQEKSASAHYMTAALDGSRPAAYRIRLYQPEGQPRPPGESVAFHETIPGHHLQVTIANERTSLPRIARFHWVAGYGEGWALYAERVADELGLYSSDADRLGMLSSAAFRAARLVVDTGLHAMGWDRQKAIDTVLAHTAMSADQASAEVDRYIAAPGQATAYMMGYLEIAALRKEAEQKLGPRFDVRAFHDRVLENGNVPLPVLRRQVEAWIRRAP